MTQRSQPAADHIANFPTSDAGPYSADQWSDMFNALFSPDLTTQGPLIRYLNELEVTLNAVGPPPVFRVDTGAAMVDGHWFKNDAVVDFTVASPAAFTRWDRVVVAVNNTNALYTVSDLGFTLDFPDNLVDYNGTNSIEPYSARLCIMQGVEGGAVPTRDTNNNHFMILLYQYQIDVAGALTNQLDVRKFCLFASTHTEVIDFVPCVDGYNLTDGAIDRYFNAGQTLMDAKLTEGIMQFIVPHNFGSDLRITPVVLSGFGSGNIYAQLSANYAQCGENFATHSVSTGYVATAITVNLISCIMETALANASKGDIVSVTFSRDAIDALDTVDADAFIKGILLIYKPDSHK